MDKYFPEANRPSFSVYAYTSRNAGAGAQALRRRPHPRKRHEAGGRPKDLELGGLLPGIKANTSATDFAPLSQMQLMKFKGETWELFGEVLDGNG